MGQDDNAALAAAIRGALRLKQKTQRQFAADMGVAAPTVSIWMSRGVIGRTKLSAVMVYFADVVGPDHWGPAYRSAAIALTQLPERERALLDAFRSLPVSRQDEELERVREARRAKWFPEPVGV